MEKTEWINDMREIINRVDANSIDRISLHEKIDRLNKIGCMNLGIWSADKKYNKNSNS